MIHIKIHTAVVMIPIKELIKLNEDAKNCKTSSSTYICGHVMTVNIAIDKCTRSVIPSAIKFPIVPRNTKRLVTEARINFSIILNTAKYLLQKLVFKKKRDYHLYL